MGADSEESKARTICQRCNGFGLAHYERAAARQLAKILQAFTVIDYCFVLFVMDRGLTPKRTLR
jgi:hypothetical protein